MKKTLVYLLLCIIFLGGLYWLFWGRYHSVSVTVSVFIGKIPQENFIIDIKGERHSTNKEGNVVFDEVSVLENDRLLLIVSKDDLQKTDTLLITKEIIDKGISVRELENIVKKLQNSEETQSVKEELQDTKTISFCIKRKDQ